MILLICFLSIFFWCDGLLVYDNFLQKVASSCVWLASKLEENPRKARQVIIVFHRMECRREDLPIEFLDPTLKVWIWSFIFRFFFNLRIHSFFLFNQRVGWPFLCTKRKKKFEIIVLFWYKISWNLAWLICSHTLILSPSWLWYSCSISLSIFHLIDRLVFYFVIFTLHF